MNIIVESSSRVLVDGTNFGAVGDTIANNPNLASGVQTALAKYETELLSAHNIALAAATEAQAASDAQHADELTAKDAEIKRIANESIANQATLTAERDTAIARVAELERYSRDEPKVKAARLADALARKAAAQADIDSLAVLNETTENVAAPRE